MRTIKFRMWSEKHNRYFYNKDEMYEHREKNEYDRALDSEEYYQPLLSLHLEINGDSEFECDGSKYVIEQFTGLHDKNGMEIYEGDVVHVYLPNNKPQRDFTATVEWNEYCCEFRLTEYDYFMKSNSYGFEVIGNIHEEELK